MERLLTFRHWLAGLLLCLAAAPVVADDAPVTEPGFTVVSAKSWVENQVVRLNARFDLRFSDDLNEALQNGVSLDLVIAIDVIKERDYIWSTTVASLQQRYEISYHPLTKHYVLHNLNNDVEFQFPNLESLVGVISVLSDFPLIDASLLEPDAHYRGEIQVAVDRDSFPVPLRLMSYVTGDWYLSSEWFAWPLLP